MSTYSRKYSAKEIIAVANQKGGVGKSTTTIHLGVAIAEMGYNVLLIDLDHQGHLAEGFGIVSDELPYEMSDVIQGTKRISDIIMQNVRPRLDLAPSNIRLSDMELTLVNMRFRESKLKRALEPVLNRYDYIFLDCPPSLGLLTVNALIAATGVIVPMAAEYFSMLGVSRLIKTIETIKHEANPELCILGIIPTRFKPNTNHSRDVVNQTKTELGDSARVFDWSINESTRFNEATGQGTTVFDLAPELPGAKAYREIAREIIYGQR